MSRVVALVRFPQGSTWFNGRPTRVRAVVPSQIAERGGATGRTGVSVPSRSSIGDRSECEVAPTPVGGGTRHEGGRHLVKVNERGAELRTGEPFPAVGGLAALVLDNTILGTREERGLAVGRRSPRRTPRSGRSGTAGWATRTTPPTPIPDPRAAGPRPTVRVGGGLIAPLEPIGWTQANGAFGRQPLHSRSLRFVR